MDFDKLEPKTLENNLCKICFMTSRDVMMTSYDVKPGKC